MLICRPSIIIVKSPRTFLNRLENSVHRLALTGAGTALHDVLKRLGGDIMSGYGMLGDCLSSIAYECIYRKLDRRVSFLIYLRRILLAHTAHFFLECENLCWRMRGNNITQ